MTKISMPSIVTSLYPMSHTVLGFDKGLPAAAKTIAEVFREEGYATLAYSSVGFTGKGNNMHQGYDELHESGSVTDNDYRSTECLLAHNHLAQMHMALGRADEAAAALAHSTAGVAERYYGRRLALRLRWQRLFGTVDATLVAELRALAGRQPSPFNRALMELELARQLPPAAALAEYTRLHHTPVALQRPGLQLHAAVLAAKAAKAAKAALAAQATHAAQAAQALHGGAAAQTWAHTARALYARCQPFDMPAHEATAALAAWG